MKNNLPQTEAERFYARCMEVLLEAGAPFMVGGGYAIRTYADIWRQSKDFDIFTPIHECPRALKVLSLAGYRTEIPNPYWLAKAFDGKHFMDILFSSPNTRCPVEHEWLERAPEANVLGLKVKLVPPEEIIFCKSYVQGRSRFDGADVIHTLRRQAEHLDWRRLLDLMGEDWEVLFAHLINFRYVYPSERDRIPDWVIAELMGRTAEQMSKPGPREKLCRGTLLAEKQYLPDVMDWGYEDARTRRFRARYGVVGPNQAPEVKAS